MCQRCFLVLLAAVSLQAAETALIREVKLDRVEFESVSSDRIQFAITPRITLAQAITIREIHFSEAFLDRIPIYIPPILERIEAKPMEALERRLVVTIYFRDLQSLAELRAMIDAGRATAKGKAVAEVGLSMVQSLFTWSRSALAPFSFAQEIPIAFPSGAISRYGAVALLRSAEAANSVVEFGLQTLGWNAPDPYADWALPVTVRYEVQPVGGAKQALEVTGYAVRYGDRGLIVVRELTAPWEYDADLKMAIETKRLRVLPDSLDVVADGLSSRRGKVRMIRAAKRDVEYTKMRHPAAGNIAIRVAERASASNLTYWEMQIARPSRAKFDLAGTAWEKLAIFRDPWPVYLRGQVENGRIRLEDPIDSRSTGSPVIGPNGIAGILQNERSAIPIAVALDALGLPAK